MQTQTVFKAGNSNVVSIPKDFNFKIGDEVVLEKADSGDVFIVRKANSKSKKSRDFKNWLDTFLKENAEILDELALH